MWVVITGTTAIVYLTQADMRIAMSGEGRETERGCGLYDALLPVQTQVYEDDEPVRSLRSVVYRLDDVVPPSGTSWRVPVFVGFEIRAGVPLLIPAFDLGDSDAGYAWDPLLGSLAVDARSEKVAACVRVAKRFLGVCATEGHLVEVGALLQAAMASIDAKQGLH